jgi:hypothetical protein
MAKVQLKRLIIVAGLGPAGTFSGGQALTDSRILQVLMREAWDKQFYYSAVIRYRFKPNDRESGILTSIIYTTGKIPPIEF